MYLFVVQMNQGQISLYIEISLLAVKALQTDKQVDFV